jgi:TPR repeat protein
VCNALPDAAPDWLTLTPDSPCILCETSMSYIGLKTASSITGLSKRTLWRRIADHGLRTREDAEPGEPTRVAVEDVLRLARLKLEAGDRELILDADAGVPEAQCDLALRFLAQDQPAEALPWLERSASRLYPEAMHQLGRCHIAGHGVPPDEQAGIAWIAKAASRGHCTAQQMMRYLEDPSRPPLAPAALEDALDRIERKLVLKVLH